jgi:hypothetical protein
MKKVILGSLAVIAILGLSGCDGAPSTSELVTANHEYEIDTWGSNSEVYEFTPKSNSSMSCVMLMLDNGKALGLQCFPKEK